MWIHDAAIILQSNKLKLTKLQTETLPSDEFNQMSLSMSHVFTSIMCF